MTIVVGGEALVDLVPHEAGELRAHAGGGPYNTARTLGRLEQDVHYLGCLSDDGFGARLRAQLVEDDVRLDTVVETPLPTTLALAELDERGAATYRFYTRGHERARAGARGGAGGAARDGRLPARRHARARDGADGDGAAGGRRGGRRPRADHGRPELPADLHPGPRRRTGAASPRRCATRTWSRSQTTTSSTSSPGVDPVERRARAARGRAAVALVTLGGDGAMIVTADDETRSRRRRSRSSTRSAPATRSAAASSPTGACRASTATRWTTRTPCGRRRRFACVVAARTCERAGASPPRLSDLDGDL